MTEATNLMLSGPVGESLVTDLRDKTINVRWGPTDRDEQFVLFSKSGFVNGLVQDVNSDWLLINMND